MANTSPRNTSRSNSTGIGYQHQQLSREDFNARLQEKPIKVHLFWEESTTEVEAIDLTPAYLKDENKKFNILPNVFQMVAFSNGEVIIQARGNEHVVPAMRTDYKVRAVGIMKYITGPLEFLVQNTDDKVYIVTQCSKLDRAILLQQLKEMRNVHFILEDWPAKEDQAPAIAAAKEKEAVVHEASPQEVERLAERFPVKETAAKKKTSKKAVAAE